MLEFYELLDMVLKLDVASMGVKDPKNMMIVVSQQIANTEEA